MSNQVALIDALSLLTSAAKDVVAALSPGQSALQRFERFQNLIPAAISAASEISDIPAEIAALQASDYASLAGVLVADLGFTNPHAQAVAAAGLKVLSDGLSVSLPDVVSFIKAVENHAA